jgi:hypothetical protein
MDGRDLIRRLRRPDSDQTRVVVKVGNVAQQSCWSLDAGDFSVEELDVIVSLGNEFGVVGNSRFPELQAPLELRELVLRTKKLELVGSLLAL